MINMEDSFLTLKIRGSRLVAVNIIYLYLMKLKSNELAGIPMDKHCDIIKSIAQDVFMSYSYKFKVDEKFVIKLVRGLNCLDKEYLAISKCLQGDWTVDSIDLKILSIFLAAYKEFCNIPRTNSKNYKAILTSEYVSLTSQVFKNHNGSIKFVNGVLDSLLQ